MSFNSIVSTSSKAQAPATKEDVHSEQWRLLRKGDTCKALHHGVQISGRIVNIIRLSNGRTLFSLQDRNGEDLGLFDSSRITPTDEEMLLENMTRFELTLRRFAPKGSSTASSSW